MQSQQHGLWPDQQGTTVVPAVMAETHSAAAPDTRRTLEEILDHGLVYSRDDGVVYESVLERDHPDIDISALCTAYADNLGNHQEAISDYLRWETL